MFEGEAPAPVEGEPTLAPEQTVDQVAEGLKEIQGAITGLAGQFADMLTRTTTMAGDIAELKVKHAAAQIPAQIEAVPPAAGAAAGQTLEGAANVAASPAATFVVKRRGFRKVKEAKSG